MAYTAYDILEDDLFHQHEDDPHEHSFNIESVGVRDLLQSSGPPQAEVRNASRGRCKKYKASTAGHSVRRPIALGHPVAKLYDVALLPLLPSRMTRWL